MANKKYIGTKDAVRLTGLSTQEIYDLIHSGRLPARKAPKSGWRISPQYLDALGLIKHESDSIVEEPQLEDSISYVADEEHYTEVFKRMTEVKRSLKIATANLKNFSGCHWDRRVTSLSSSTPYYNTWNASVFCVFY